MIKRLLMLSGIILLILATAFGVWTFKYRDKNKELVPTPPHVINTNSPSTTPKFDKTRFSLEDPTSLWVIANKHRPLKPTTFVPNDLKIPNVPLRVPGNESMQLRSIASTALESLFAGAKTDGINLMLSSGYRSYSYQVSLYSGYVNKSGQASADKFSARPGFSEHQTGLAADIEPLSQKCDVDSCFADLPEGIWLAANAYKYGFTIRYPLNKTSITGYTYEPWHIRYVGAELAKKLHDTNTATLEEFFGLEAAPDYL